MTEKKRRRKVKQGDQQGGGDDMDEDNDNDEIDDVAAAEDNLESLALSTAAAQSGDTSPADEPMNEDNSELTASASQGAEGGVFTVTIGSQSSGASAGQASGSGACSAEEKLFVPMPRMKPCMAVKNGVLYLYGGMFEDGDRQVTLCDFYALDLSKLDVWKTIIAQNIELLVCVCE